ncbi:UPF0489 family protein [Candidatus Pacearchaeota archaeon]|nr:UPF0489 family protein [Candidatus Pacearchaeota archaeon]
MTNIPGLEYTEPRVLNIAGIKTVIVDPHNEVFSYWYNLVNSSSEISIPAALLHIDKHDDLWERKNVINGEDIDSYARNLDISSFIAPAFHYKIIDKFFWFNPRKFFPRTIVDCKTHEHENQIFWNDASSFHIPRTRLSFTFLMTYRLNHHKGSLIVDIDLDAFLDKHDAHYLKYRTNRNACFRKVEKRIKGARRLLRRIKKPDLITIARSQNPNFFTPPEYVEYIEGRVLEVLGGLY